MSGLSERYAVQHVGSPARWQGAHHEPGQVLDRAVEDLRALDALGDHGRPGRARRVPGRATGLLTEELPHNREVPRRAGGSHRLARYCPRPGARRPRRRSGLEAVSHPRLGEQVPRP